MCSDPSHAKDFKLLNESIIRMETKLDNVLTITTDHESRLRLAETAILLQKGIRAEHEDTEKHITKLDGKVDKLTRTVDNNDQTLASMKKVLWAIALAIASTIGVTIVDMMRKGM